ncbi:proline--tRNA ligase [Ramlibacter sp. WS9]|uniref:proline--tRNA ligase n=1 Tax=Ramlibacter sp. WS9 TaxID=1882741 RepID=UPI0011434554|nr:proline--tRNA ligase [Ramlibacter sp. WS9]ROZ72725.1 proline--tRNA ligase [Ramlibacter sp. WS9]
MKASQFFISTQKEAPADAEVVSHQLMMRAGMVKKLGAGIYSWMPMGLRVVRKIEAIVREEMNRAGAVELLMPVVQPAEYWQETGRWEKMGPELMRVKDRHDRDFIIQPTSEEVVTDIARQELRSYKQLPKNLYHIQTKFRDERRPRFGVMRSREFIMKDAYSFDRDEAGAKASYQAMAKAYRAIFDRFGLRYRAVAADSGAIGGDLSEEFQVIAATGEDAIVYCPDSTYAANMEKAEALPPKAGPVEGIESPVEVETPGMTTCEQVAQFLDVPLAKTVKSIVLATEASGQQPKIWLLLIRGDHTMNEVKVAKIAGFENGWRPASASEIFENFGCRPGYIGPFGKPEEVVLPPFPVDDGFISSPVGRPRVNLVVDLEVACLSDWVCGANRDGYHRRGANWTLSHLSSAVRADIRNVVEGDPSPDGKGALAIERGIEIGHIFFLGTKYSDPMKASFLDENGKPQLMQMGCYGIGITRLPAAAIEQNNDERGIIWPDAIAPFTVVVCPIGMDRSADVKAAAEKLHDELLAAGVDVMLDDRGERPGAMFADWELIGVPHRVVISDRGLKEGQLEYQHRRDAQATKVPAGEVFGFIKGRLKP